MGEIGEILQVWSAQVDVRGSRGGRKLTYERATRERWSIDGVDEGDSERMVSVNTRRGKQVVEGDLPTAIYERHYED